MYGTGSVVCVINFGTIRVIAKVQGRLGLTTIPYLSLSMSQWCVEYRGRRHSSGWNNEPTHNPVLSTSQKCFDGGDGADEKGCSVRLGYI